MAKLEPRTRTVLEPFADFNVSNSSASNSPIRSLAISTISDSEYLIYLGTNSDSIQVISHIGTVLVVTDGSMFLVDSLLLQPVKKLSSVRGVSVVARRFRSGESVVRNGGNGVSSASEVSGQRFLDKFGSGIRSNGVKVNQSESSELLIRDDNCVFAVVVGKKILLLEVVLDVGVGRIDRNRDNIGGTIVILKEIPCVEGVKTMVWIDDSIIVGSFIGYSLYSCVTGQSGLIFSLPDLSSPPRLKLLLKEYNVLLLVDNVGVIVNAEGQPVGGSLVFRRAPDSVAEIGSSVVVVRNGNIELYHKKSGNCIQMVSFAGEGVGSCIVRDEEDGNGKLVAVATPTKVICYRKVPSEEQIKYLLRKKSFKEAISLVEELQSEGELTKEMLSFVHAQVGFLLLFDMHFKEAVDHFMLSETMQPSEVFPFITRDPNRWSLMVPRNRYWGLHPPPEPLEKVVDDGLVSIQRAAFLKKAGVETAVDDEFLLNPPSRADLLESAIKNIIRYLQASREKDLNPSVREGVDTLLMYLYRALNCVDDMERLASSENHCIVEELETLLNDSGHLRTLAFLYASKGMSSKAVAIWRLLARNYSLGYWKNPAGENDSHDASINGISVKEAAASEASRILEESSDQDLVLQHLGWIADINQILAVQVLTSEKRYNLLSPDDVIAAIDPKKVEILQRYLQWLIEDQDSDDTLFHTTYALLLAKSSLETSETKGASQKSEGHFLDGKDISDSRRDSIFQSLVRERLQIFLQSSDLYDPEEVLDLIEGSELWLEKAILYRKLGQETLVLQILALKLEDSEAAEQYCAEIGRPDVYMQLLEMYLDPKDGKEPMFKAAVRLLHNHGESLDPLQVLERLSPDMPLQLASDTILRMLRARLHHHRQGQIVHNLFRAVDIDSSLARFEERSRHVQINDESLCDSCHSRLGTKLFAMYPDDTIVCYKCFRRQGESTSVTGRDFKQDIMFKPGWLVTR
ncbi:unnamed protein product [Ilex paraguariensis]|uniref:CNH domain-containing protein n=1 Tax=Ilex paraguariensis TaxID=185542 RepID=A0ABC8UTS0_9AQUA